MNKRKLGYKRYFKDGHSPPAMEGCPKGGVVSFGFGTNRNKKYCGIFICFKSIV